MASNLLPMTVYYSKSDGLHTNSHGLPPKLVIPLVSGWHLQCPDNPRRHRHLPSELIEESIASPDLLIWLTG